MKAVVFGGAGFLGSYVADELSERGFDVLIYDRYPSPYLRKDQEMVVGDILDRDKILSVIQGCDYVYHFAGIAGIAEAREKPLDTIKTNVLGTTNIVDACRNQQVKRLVFASTVYVYSDLAPFYRSSKQACELIIDDYSQAYGLDFTILRYGSLYGKRANHFNYIYKIIEEAVETGKILRKGDGGEIRDYIHVRDAAKCSVDILSDDYRNQHVLLTGTQSIKIKHLLTMIKEMFNNEINIEYSDEADPGHYEITPYLFRPRVAKKLISDNYYDLGQGILDIIFEVYSNSSKNGKHLTQIRQMIEPH